METITIRRGDTYSYSMTFKTSGEVPAPVDLTGFTVWFTVRKCYASTAINSDLDAVISKEFTDGDASGVIVFDLGKSDTNIPAGSYLYDIQYDDASGHRKSTNPASFIVEPDVTRS